MSHSITKCKVTIERENKRNVTYSRKTQNCNSTSNWKDTWNQRFSAQAAWHSLLMVIMSHFLRQIHARSAWLSGSPSSVCVQHIGWSFNTPHSLTRQGLIWCSSSGSPRSARMTSGPGPPPDGSNPPPPPPRWCHTGRSGGGALVGRPCRHRLSPETGGTPPSPKAANGQAACPCWSPWWTVAQMRGRWDAEWRGGRVDSRLL